MIDQNKLNLITSNVGDMNLKRRIHTILRESEIQNDDIILDCGCGHSLFLVAISELTSCQIHGLDVDFEKIIQTQNDLGNKMVRLVHGDITSLPYQDEYFNKIYCSEVLEHIPDDKRALKELRRVLKKKGTLIITVPNHNYPFLWDPLNKILEILFKKHIRSGFWAGIWNMHLRLYYPWEINNLVEKSGFRIRNCFALTHFCIPFNHIILYGLKQILNKGLLPKSVQHTGDKFSWREKEQSRLIKFGYWVLNKLDRLNDNLPLNKSSVNILIKAEKV